MKSGVRDESYWVQFYSFLDSPAQIWAQQWSWWRPVCLPPSNLSSSALSGSRWHPAAPACDTITPEWHRKAKRAHWELITTEWLTPPPCASGGSSPAWSKPPAWSAPSATCRNTSGSSAAAPSLHDGEKKKPTAARDDGSPAVSPLAGAPSRVSHRSPPPPGRACWRCRPRCLAAGRGRPRPAGSPGRPGAPAWRSCTPAPSAARPGQSELPRGITLGSIQCIWKYDCKLLLHFCSLKIWRNVTFVKISAYLFPLGKVVVKYDASLVHADAAESRFAPKAWTIVCVLQYVVHSWWPEGIK